jgi:hypothetical protein
MLLVLNVEGGCNMTFGSLDATQQKRRKSFLNGDKIKVSVFYFSRLLSLLHSKKIISSIPYFPPVLVFVKRKFNSVLSALKELCYVELARPSALSSATRIRGGGGCGDAGDGL